MVATGVGFLFLISFKACIIFFVSLGNMFLYTYLFIVMLLLTIMDYFGTENSACEYFYFYYLYY